MDGLSHWSLQVTLATRAITCSARPTQESAARRFLAGDEVLDDEEDVGGALGQASHVPGEPGFAVADQDPEPVAGPGESLLLLAADSVEHLKLQSLGRQVRGTAEVFDPAYEHGVVRAEDRADSLRAGVGRQKQRRQLEIVLVHVALLRERLVRRLAVGALDQPYP